MEIKKAAEHSNTSKEVIKASIKLGELKKETKEVKEDLDHSKEILKEAKYEMSTAITKK